MGKAADIDDLLGGEAKPSKKAPAKKTAPVVKVPDAPAAKKTAKVEAPAKPAAKKAAEPVAEVKEKAARAPKEPVVFEEGEREALAKRVKQVVKKPWNSRELAAKLDVPTRKLRAVLYGMQKREEIALEAGASKVTGMTVSPA